MPIVCIDWLNFNIKIIESEIQSSYYKIVTV